MLDGRVKTLHPRIHAGILADRRVVGHRAALAAVGIEPFDLVVVNLYPFAAAAERAANGELDLDGLIEEIDIGGPAMVRAAAKNLANVTIVTSPARYPTVLEALDTPGGIPAGLRAALAIEAFRHTAAYDARIAEVLPCELDRAKIALPDEPGLPRSLDPFPAALVVGLEKVETLRYGENPHQAAARYRRPGATDAEGPFASGAAPLQGKPLSYNNILDASAASALGRALRGPACVIVKHTNPCGAAERGDLAAAWDDALAADPVSAFGGVVALTGAVDGEVAEQLVSIFLEIVVAPGFDPDARAILARRSNLRLVVDPRLGSPSTAAWPAGRGAIRTAGGAVLVTAPDTIPDDQAGWGCVTRREPTARERADLDLAWRLVRGVTSNAIVLVRDGMLVGLGSGQTSRVDAARQAVEKARSVLGPERLAGAVCASDAFFPFPDGVEVCLAAGVTAFVQPGGSLRDAEVTAVADAAGAAMLVTEPGTSGTDRSPPARGGRPARVTNGSRQGPRDLPPAAARGAGAARHRRRPCYDRPAMPDRPDRFYVTTSIAYANNRPGLHTLYEVIGADALARWYRMCGIPTRFLTGTDEHSVNIAMRAAEEGRSPRAFVDEQVGRFRAAEDALLISPDRFIRTTDPDHVRAVQEMVRRAHANGDIYLGMYEGWYCPNEGFRNATDVVETAAGTICPNHPDVPLQWLSERNWFFRLSAYQERLERWFEEDPDRVEPDHRRNEMLGFIRGGLEDLSISRPGAGWGIPFPILPDGRSAALPDGTWDPAAGTIYVWYDALINYITGAGFPDDPAGFADGGRPISTSSARTSPASTRSSGPPCSGRPGSRRRGRSGCTAGSSPRASG